MGGYNPAEESNFLGHLSCELYEFENLIKQPTCYKNPINPSSIDVMLTNSENSFQNNKAIETGLYDYHKKIIIVLKTYTKNITYYNNLYVI